MRISGFSIARQAVDFGYPLEESLRSLLPLVDELIVGVGDADDGTWELVASIQDPKVKAFRSVWDLSQPHATVLSDETNKAMDRCTGDWGFYLQADEVLHEDDLEGIRAAIARGDRLGIDGIALRYHHFYGSYSVVQDDPARFYPRATRAVRLGGAVRSVGDACGFMRIVGDRARRLRRADIDAHIYHYGWARPPDIMSRKQNHLEGLYGRASHITRDDIYEIRGNLRRFDGTHPAVMRSRVAAQDWDFDPRLEAQAPEWLRRPYAYTRWFFIEAARRVRRRWAGPV